jgi:hypothetical protein
MSRSGVPFTVDLIVASVAQDLTVRNVVHALGRDVTRNDVVHNLTESSAPSAQRRRCEQLVAELPPLPPSVDTQLT